MEHRMMNNIDELQTAIAYLLEAEDLIRHTMQSSDVNPKTFRKLSGIATGINKLCSPINKVISTIE